MPKLSKSDHSAKVSANEARRRKEQALAELREMERDEKLGLLLRADQVADAWTKILGEVRAAVLRIPDQCALPASAAKDVRQIRTILETECQHILRNLTNDVHRLAENGNTRRGKRAASPAAHTTGGVDGKELPAQQ